MKTIEQHLQELFVGKKVRIRSQRGGKPYEAIGIVISFNQIMDSDMKKDVYEIKTNNDRNLFYSDDENDLIEIIP